VLDFWKANVSTNPQFAALTPATFGISAERCFFFAAGLITSVHRLTMLPEALKKIGFHESKIGIAV